MTLLFGVFVTVLGLAGIAYLFSQMKTEQATQSLRVVLGLLGVIVGVILTLRGLAVAGVPLITAAVGLLAVALRGGHTGHSDPDERAPRGSNRPMTRKEAAATLGVSETASEDDIRAAYRELMKKVHPDAGGNDALAAKVQEARDVLLGD